VAAPGNFDVATQRQASVLIVAPRGEIDLATIGLAREAVERELQPGEDLVVDFRGVGFLDTSGLRWALELRERAAREAFELRLVRGPRAVQRAFEVAGLESRLPFVDDLPAATGE
jgi:anti-sigma B factor antagonist